MDEDEIVFTLRSYAGVHEIERLLDAAQAQKSPLWSDEYLKAQALADALSKRLFGVVAADTQYKEDPYAARDDNEARWVAWEPPIREGAALTGPPAEILEGFHLDYGWDVSDGQGGLLRCLPFFARQIVAASEGIVGRLPDGSMSEEEASGLEARLRAEADKFRPKR